MKFLIDNYCTDHSTQSLYLYNNLNKHKEHEAFIRMNAESSIYDSFDRIKPDFYITSVFLLTKDAISYIQENKNTNIQFILCANNATQDIINKIEASFEDDNIPCAFIFSNDQSLQTKKIRFVHLPECADMHHSQIELPKFKIKKAIFVNDTSNIKQYDGTFHIISTNMKLKQDVDICLPVNVMSNLYNRYDEIIFNYMHNYIPQAFFDAIAHGNKVYYDIENKDIEKETEALLNKVFKLEPNESLNFNNSNKIDKFDTLRSMVLEKHGCANRTKTLLSQIPHKKL